jgi:acetate kinase
MTGAGVLVLNAGSSSIKFQFFATDRGGLDRVLSGRVEGIHSAPRFVASGPDGTSLGDKTWPEGTRLGHEGAVSHLVEFLPGAARGFELAAVGHRVVHGGQRFSRPVRVDAKIVDVLERFVPLAPLHQPHNLAPIRLLLSRRPGLPQVACFDTAFHATAPDVARRYALPSELHDAGVLRYGFHGLSYEFIASALPRYDARAAAGSCVVCHLGNGSSMCALAASKSVATTMGFTALEGLPMGTRSGSIDPGVLIYLMDQRGMSTREVESLLYDRSGLLGVSGVSSDMRTLLASDDPRASLAIDVYVYRIGRELGSLAAALGGVDALVFTGGIGENAAAIRERVCDGAAWLGVTLDRAANARGGPRISSEKSRVAAWVIPTDEELMIATHTLRLIAS